MPDVVAVVVVVAVVIVAVVAASFICADLPPTFAWKCAQNNAFSWLCLLPLLSQVESP